MEGNTQKISSNERPRSPAEFQANQTVADRIKAKVADSVVAPKQEGKAVERAQEMQFVKIANGFKKQIIEFKISHNGRPPSELEARGMVLQMKEDLASAKEGMRVSDKAFLDRIALQDGPTFKTGVKIEVETDKGQTAVFELVLKTDTGQYDLEGDLSNAKGKYAEQILN